MTRNKPWRGDAAASQQSTVTTSETTTRQPNLAANSEAAHTTTDSRFPSTTGTAVVSDPNAVNSATPEKTEAHATAKPAYAPPTAADVDGEDVLHVYQPEEDEDNEVYAEDPLESVASSAPQDHDARTREQQHNRDTHETPADDEDLTTALSNLLSGRASDHRAGPFGFLDVMAGAIAGAFPSASPAEDHRSPRGPLQESREADKTSRATSPARGHFHASSSNISLEEQRYLVARCKDCRGVPQHSKLDLNDCLSNDNGHFRWTRGGNFRASARNIELTTNGEVLRAELRARDGRWKTATIRLPQRISNKNGQLVLIT
ncbi:hypothetical protein AMS68_001480 [Peltaster fructicola]|uniref:Cyanovirin-N domain-containing protein n=1 Tax=Peltaster fructicola TaxID=286661 RepID=A0A6H0XML5_9PEZI|nr:hypothetical protein AMS68_001480 [Peltaster fructicola]